MIQATVLHPGYVMQEIERAVESTRYQELTATLIAWHELPGHDCSEPPAEVVAILAELKAMKLHAFVSAGRLYRKALDAYEAQCSWEAMAAKMGLPFVRDTAVEYVVTPKEPIELDFDYPA